MKKLIALSAAALLAMSLAACGGSSADTAASGEAASADSTAESTAESTSSSDKVWIIATDTAFMPFEYTDDDGNFVGIDVDLLAAVAEDQGFQYKLQALGWDSSIAACQTGQADGMIAGASITDERKETGWMFSDPYYTGAQTIAVAADSDIDSWEDLAGKSVAAKNGAMGAEYADSMKDQYGFTVVKFDDSPTMYQDVLAGNSAGCFDDAPVMAAYIKQHDLALKLIDSFANEGSDYGFAVFSEDSQELLDMFNAGLANIKANGKYDEIIDKYLGL